MTPHASRQAASRRMVAVPSRRTSAQLRRRRRDDVTPTRILDRGVEPVRRNNRHPPDTPDVYPLYPDR